MSSSIPSPCLPYRRHLVFVPSPSRPRPLIISYQIPDDTATQSITCDTGYDDISFHHAPLPASSYRSYCFPPRFPPNRVARRIGSRHELLVSTACPASPISSVHLPSRPASRFASRRASSLVSSRLTACYASSLLLASLRRTQLIHLIGLSPIVPPDCQPYDTPDGTPHDKSPTPHRMRRATSRRNGARDGENNDEEAERHAIRHLTDNVNTPPRPPYSPYEPHNARTPTRTRQRENDPSTGITTPLTGRQRDDGRDGMNGTTRRLVLPAYRRRQDAPSRNAACLLPDTTTRRPTPPLAYRHDDETSNATATATRSTTRPHGTNGRDEKDGKRGGMSDGTESGTKKKRAAIRKEKRPEKRKEV